MEHWKVVEGTHGALWENVFEASRKATAAQRKPIIAYKDGAATEFSSVSEAERIIGSRHITDVLKGKRRQAKGYTFAYKEGGDADVHRYYTEA